MTPSTASSFCGSFSFGPNPASDKVDLVNLEFPLEVPWELDSSHSDLSVGGSKMVGRQVNFLPN